MLFRATDPPGEESRPPTTAALALPTIATLLATGAVASLACRTPDKPFASLGGVLACAVWFLLLAGAAHAGAVCTVCRVYRTELHAPVRLLLQETWICAALLPVTVLLAKAGSEWATPVLPAIAVAAVLFVRREAPDAGRDAHAAAPAGVSTSLFAFEQPPMLVRTLLPAAVTVLLLEAGTAMLLSWQYALAGLLFGLAVTAVLWRVPLGRWQPRAPRRREGRSVVWGTAVALLLTVTALLPSLGGSALAGPVRRLLGAGGARKAPLPRRAPQVAGATGGALSGVILTLPPKPRETVLPPPPHRGLAMGGAKTQPVVLPFDGAYWYFREPEPRPRPDARTVRGDPTKVDVQTTDRASLQMEAHQSITPAMETGCCSEIAVRIRNADTRPGLVALEVVLSGSDGGFPWRRSLGTRVVASSVDRHGAEAAEETLRFPMGTEGQGRRFDEITVVIRPARERARLGTRIAVEQFALAPAL